MIKGLFKLFFDGSCTDQYQRHRKRCSYQGSHWLVLPEECVQVMRDRGIHCIAGNVEIQLATGQDDCACGFVDGGRCDTFSRQWYPYVQSKVEYSIFGMDAVIASLLTVWICRETGGRFAWFFSLYSEFIFASTDRPVKEKNFTDLQSTVILAGHGGLPIAHQKNGNFWLNTGVIGMLANDGTSRAWYLLLDDRKGFQYQHRPLMYDYKKASWLMTENNLPQAYAKTLVTGIWDNYEILPEEEAKMQGRVIEN